MAGFLFDQIVFGPVLSRRMGVSLGMNLLPLHSKCCTFNCIYCECGWTISHDPNDSPLPPANIIAQALEEKLRSMAEKPSQLPDAITFAGNGEPTLHPEFATIIDDTVRLRDKYAPKAKISVLSNGSMLEDDAVFRSLFRVDMNIQKLDAGTEETLKHINQPFVNLNIDNLVDQLARFKGKVIVQTLFLRGIYNGVKIDNTTDLEVDAWIGHLKKIKPEYVMIYPIARETPTSDIEKIRVPELNEIAKRVNFAGIETKVYP